MKHLLFAIGFTTFASFAHAQVNTNISSPNGKLKIEIKADKELNFTVTDDGKQLISSTPDLLLQGKKPSQYHGSSTKAVKEHFDAPNYKITSFDDEYNQLIVKNKNGVNVEFRAYNSGIAYRFFTTSTKGEWTVKDEVAQFTFTGDHTAYLPYSTNPQEPQGDGLPSHLRCSTPLTKQAARSLPASHRRLQDRQSHPDGNRRGELSRHVCEGRRRHA